MRLLGLVLLVARLAVANENLTTTIVMPMGRASGPEGPTHGSIVGYDAKQNLTTFMEDLPYLAPENVIGVLWDRSATVVMGPSSWREHYTIQGNQPNGRRMAAEHGTDCSLDWEAKNGTCQVVKTARYMDNLDSIVATETVSVYTQKLGINYYTVLVTAGVEKLATKTATPGATEEAATTTSMTKSTTSNPAAQKTQNIVLAGAAVAAGAFIL